MRQELIWRNCRFEKLKITVTSQVVPMGDRKVAVVAGSVTCAGAATALLLARCGYNVLINYSKSEAEAQASQAACRDAGADTGLALEFLPHHFCMTLSAAAFLIRH